MTAPLRILRRRSGQDVIGSLNQQVATARAAARLALETAQGTLESDRARIEMRRLEHVGDDHQRAVTRILRHTFAAPIDREDLFRVSRSIDDVLDNLRDFVREYDLFGMTSDDLLVGVLHAVVEGIESLHPAIDALGVRASPDHDATVAARKNGIRQRYHAAMATLLSQEVDGHTLKRRELLRQLDVVGLRISEAADALADGAVKRSH